MRLSEERSRCGSLFNISDQDLKRCHDLLGSESWQALAGKRIFMTGGTGFIGKWLLATLLDADEVLDLRCHVTVLSRDPAAFQRSWPVIVGRVEWRTGDVRDFTIDNERFDVILHGATDVAGPISPYEVLSTCIDGTRRVLDLARVSCASSLLLLSSGAVYGPPPIGMTHIPETHLGGPDPLLGGSAYAEGKRISEWLVSQAGDNRFGVKIARVFALVGPHMPLDRHFAIGNFIRAVLANEEIVIQGDGVPHRSYLYAADMAAWLWAVLLRGESGRAYNVGSDESLSISTLAHRVCQVLKRDPRIVHKKRPEAGGVISHYVPDITRARKELKMPSAMMLDEAILRTARMYNPCI